MLVVPNPSPARRSRVSTSESISTAVSLSVSSMLMSVLLILVSHRRIEVEEALDPASLLPDLLLASGQANELLALLLASPRLRVFEDAVHVLDTHQLLVVAVGLDAPGQSLRDGDGHDLVLDVLGLVSLEVAIVEVCDPLVAQRVVGDGDRHPEQICQHGANGVFESLQAVLNLIALLFQGEEAVGVGVEGQHRVGRHGQLLTSAGGDEQVHFLDGAEIPAPYRHLLHVTGLVVLAVPGAPQSLHAGLRGVCDALSLGLTLAAILLALLLELGLLLADLLGQFDEVVAVCLDGVAGVVQRGDKARAAMPHGIGLAIDIDGARVVELKLHWSVSPSGHSPTHWAPIRSGNPG